MIWFILNQVTIFVSYTVISLVVFFMYVKHASSIDNAANRWFVLNVGLFLIMCALTHLYSIFDINGHVILSTGCSIISFSSAVLTLYKFSAFDDHLSKRINAKEILTMNIVKDLCSGYDLRGTFCGQYMTEGWMDSTEVSSPILFQGELKEGSVVNILDKYYRITRKLTKSVPIPRVQSWNILIDDFVEDVDVEDLESYTVYGYDATALIHVQNEEKRMNALKMSLCMATAHDIRTPLSSLGIVFSCLQSMSISMNREEYDKLLDEGFVNMEMINLIVTQFMEIGKMDSKTIVRPTMGDVNTKVLQERVDMMGKRLCSENVKFRSTIDSDVPIFVISDSDWIWQITLNLLTNAAKYTYKGYVHVNLQFQDSHLILVVADTGIGIDDVNKATIFDKYVTFKTFGHDSHGIGLYSVKTKVELLHGEVNVKDNVVDNVVNGTVFEVRIPVEIQHVVDKVEEQTLSKTCLIIDDTPSIRKMVTQLLRKHVVETATNGAQGLEMMQAKMYDLVLLDMYMPVMDGLQCIKRFRSWEKMHRQHRQVIYSMSANERDVSTSFDGAIPKPIDGKRLGHILAQL